MHELFPHAPIPRVAFVRWCIMVAVLGRSFLNNIGARLLD